MPETYIIKNLLMDGGERVVLIISKRSAIPHTESSRYLLMRRKVVSVNTIRKEAKVIIKLLNRASFGVESSSLDFMDSLRVNDLYSLWSDLKLSSSGGEVCGTTHSYRWRVAQDYLKHVSNVALSGMSVKDPFFHAVAKKRDILFEQMSKLNFKPSAIRKSGLEKEVINSIVSASRTTSLDNPWIERDRLRNQLIVDILLGLGLRASELLKISIQDISLGTSSPNLVIKRVINDPEDKRVIEPRVKTFGRIIDLSSDLAQTINTYLKQRRTVPGAKRTKFLFVSNTTGDPISYARLHGVIKDLALAVGNSDISPHSFRRTWNDRFREAAESLKIGEEMITQSQNYLQGRVLNSPEAYKYASKHIERVAREIHIKYQDSLISRGKK